MSSPDSSNDFSHLPTVDESQAATGGDASALWQQHRRKSQAQAGAKPAPAAEEQQPPAHPVAPPAAADPEAWRDLLELEADEPMSYGRPPSPPPKPAPPATPKKRSIIRPTRKAEPSMEESVPQPQHSAEAAFRMSEPDPVEQVVRKSEAERSAESPPKEETDAEPEDTPSASEAAKSKSESHPSRPPVTIEPVTAPKSPWQHRWEKIGGRALGLSVALHFVILGGAALYVVGRVMEPQVDFLPGGGSAQSQAASQALQNKIQQKKNPWLKKSMPIRRLAALNTVSEFNLPDAPDAFELPDVSNLLNNKVGAGVGMGLAGAGGGFGTGMGLGSRSGMVFQPFTMFGRQINARRMALVLDVSASMAPHLPRVIAEVDKVAKDSVVVLFVGCGLEPPPPRGLDGEEVYRTSGQEFERFWRLGGATLEESRKFKFSPQDVIPQEEIFRLLSRRPNTFFIHAVGLGYTWLALLSNEVRSADALYWFSDFQDRVEFRQIGILRENLLNRKQKLYIHAYQRGSAFDLVVSQLVQPTNGDVIEADP